MPALQNTIWDLVNLGHELDDIASKLDSLAAQLNRGVVDKKLYEDTYNLVWNRPEQQGPKTEVSAKPGQKPFQARNFVRPNVN